MVNFVYLKKPFIAFVSPFFSQVAKICRKRKKTIVMYGDYT